MKGTNLGTIIVEGRFKGGNRKVNADKVLMLNFKEGQEGREVNLDNVEASGLTISDPKRRRMDRPNVVERGDNQEMEDEIMMDSKNKNQDLKYLLKAGSVSQTRLSLGLP